MENFHNREFQQNLAIIVSSDNHETCLELTKPIKKQCEAWWFWVEYNEYKSARKGPVLKREIMIKQKGYSDDIIIFKEAIRRICQHMDIFFNGKIEFKDQGSVPIN